MFLGDIIAIEDNQAVLLTYFRNNILHAFVLPSLVASLVEHNGKINKTDLSNVIRTLYPFLKAELFMKWQAAELQQHIDTYINALVQIGLIFQDHDGNLFSPTPNSEEHQNF